MSGQPDRRQNRRPRATTRLGTRQTRPRAQARQPANRRAGDNEQAATAGGAASRGPGHRAGNYPVTGYTSRAAADRDRAGGAAGGAGGKPASTGGGRKATGGDQGGARTAGADHSTRKGATGEGGKQGGSGRVGIRDHRSPPENRSGKRGRGGAATQAARVARQREGAGAANEDAQTEHHAQGRAAPERSTRAPAPQRQGQKRRGGMATRTRGTRRQGAAERQAANTRAPPRERNESEATTKRTVSV